MTDGQQLCRYGKLQEQFCGNRRLTGVHNSMVRHAGSSQSLAEELDVLLLVLSGVVLPIGVVGELAGLSVPGEC